LDSTGDRIFGDVALKEAGPQHVARDIVEPEALAQIAELDASKNSPFGCVSDSICLVGSETNRCAEIQDFLMLTSV
jgi:hypothetical protein